MQGVQQSRAWCAHKKEVVPLFAPVVDPPQRGGREEEGAVEVGDVLRPCREGTKCLCVLRTASQLPYLLLDPDTWAYNCMSTPLAEASGGVLT